MTLLVTWSLGAAAGIGGTLVTLRFATGLPAGEPSAQFNARADSTDPSPKPPLHMAQDHSARSSDSNSADENEPAELTSRPDGSSALAALKATAYDPWPAFSRERLGFNNKAGSTLTPLSLAMDLSAESTAGQWLGFPPVATESSTSTNTGDEETFSASLPQPAKFRPSPPTSQRDLLQHLLNAYGAS
jgi:hypothetical protein